MSTAPHQSTQYPVDRKVTEEISPNIMRTMQRSKEEIIKEKLGGAVQVLPNDGLFAVEVGDNIEPLINFESNFIRERKRRKRSMNLQSMQLLEKNVRKPLGKCKKC